MPANVLGKLFHRGVAPLRFFAQSFQNDHVEIARQLLLEPPARPVARFQRRCRRHLQLLRGLRNRGFRVAQNHRARPLGFLFADGLLDLGIRAASARMRQCSGQKLVEQHSQRINIGRRGDRLAADLFRTGVVERHRTLIDARRFVGNKFGAQQFGDAEVEQLRRAIRGHQDIAGFDVAMHHQAPVRVFYGPAHRAEKLKALRDGAFAALAILVDARAIHILHHQIRQALRSRAAVQQARDIRVVQTGEHLPLRAKSPQDFARVHAAQDHFDGDFPLVFVIHARGQPHRSHSPAADAPLQLIGSDPVAFRKLAGILGGAEQASAQIGGRLRHKILGIGVA